MCSKNPEVGTLFALFITKVFLIQRIFRVLRNSLFQNKRPLLKKQNGARSLQGKNLLRFVCRDIIWRKDSILEKSIPFLINLKERQRGLWFQNQSWNIFSCSAHESGKLRRQLSQERSSSPERSLWMIFGERSVRRIVREICPESTPMVAARSLMLENFPSSIIFCQRKARARASWTGVYSTCSLSEVKILVLPPAI